MRKLFLWLLLLLPIAVMSQSKFGYFSYSGVLDSVPQYVEAVSNYNQLKQRCIKEIEHNELELTRFYVAYLDGQRDFPEPILRKRQKELQQMIDNSVHFRDQLKQWLRQAKDSLCRPSFQLVDSALARVCREMPLTYVIDTDDKAYKYINPDFGVDITSDVISAVLFPELPVRKIISSEDSVSSVAFQPFNGFIATDKATYMAIKRECVADSVSATAVKNELVIPVVHKENADTINNR